MPTAQTFIKPFYKDGEIDFSNFNSITFYNQGNVTVLINGLLKIAPKVSFAIRQSESDVIDTTKYFFNFLPADADSASSNQNQSLAIIVVITSK